MEYDQDPQRQCHSPLFQEIRQPTVIHQYYPRAAADRSFRRPALLIFPPPRYSLLRREDISRSERDGWCRTHTASCWPWAGMFIPPMNNYPFSDTPGNGEICLLFLMLGIQAEFLRERTVPDHREETLQGEWQPSSGGGCEAAERPWSP